MKLAFAALLIATAAMPAEAGPRKYSSRPGYASENKCYKTKYREEYIPGTSNNRGYVRTWREKKEIPCKRRKKNHYHDRYYHETNPNVGRRYHDHDNNSCVEGTVAGGLLGGALGGVLSKKENWIWAIPTGIVGGAMVGCQVDGG